jgi:hypothetical protein
MPRVRGSAAGKNRWAAGERRSWRAAVLLVVGVLSFAGCAPGAALLLGRLVRGSAAHGAAAAIMLSLHSMPDCKLDMARLRKCSRGMACP